jgi:hypothetical protein
MPGVGEADVAQGSGNVLHPHLWLLILEISSSGLNYNQKIIAHATFIRSLFLPSYFIFQVSYFTFLVVRPNGRILSTFRKELRTKLDTNTAHIFKSSTLNRNRYMSSSILGIPVDFSLSSYI